MKNRVVTALLAAAVITAAAFGQTQLVPGRDADERPLERRVTVGRNWETAATSAFKAAVNDARLPGGIVAVSSCGVEPKYIFTPAGPTARDAFDAIALTDARYRWEADGGVVNLLPHAGAPPFLNLRIAWFKAQNAGTVYEAVGQLLELPEVQRGIAEHGIGARRFRGGVGHYEPPRKRADGSIEVLSVDIKDVTLRGALNAIARAHGSAVWYYAEHRCGSTAFTLEFLAQ